jgi:hypothetical protein
MNFHFIFPLHHQSICPFFYGVITPRIAASSPRVIWAYYNSLEGYNTTEELYRYTSEGKTSLKPITKPQKLLSYRHLTLSKEVLSV